MILRYVVVCLFYTIPVFADPFSESELIDAIGARDFSRVEKALKNGSPINDPSDLALLQAANSGDVKILNYLLENGAEVNGRDQYGFTALMMAIYTHQVSDESRVQEVQTLLDHGANLDFTAEIPSFLQDDRQKYNGLTALEMAQKNENTKIIQLIQSETERRKHTRREGLKQARTKNSEFIAQLTQKEATVDPLFTEALISAFALVQAELAELVGSVLVCPVDLTQWGFKLKEIIRAADKWEESLYPKKIHKEDFKVEIRDGRIHSSSGQLLGDGSYMYAIDRWGHIYLHRRAGSKTFMHTFFLSGQPVLGAGQLTLKDGSITKLDLSSGHYKPDASFFKQVLAVLLLQGYRFDRVPLVLTSP